MISHWLLAFFALACESNALTLPSNIATRQAPSSNADTSGIFFNVGQNYETEWDGFANSIKKPAGISVYGDIYSGALNPDSQNLLSTYAESNTGHVEIGFSWKDAMTENGYTQYQGAQLQNDITSGKYDNELHSFASYLSQYRSVNYLMRVEYEVSTQYFANTNPTTIDPSTFDLTAYPAAYRHVRAIVAAQVSNIAFVYHAVRGEAPTLYPGDDVVDYIGFSIFNNDVCLPAGSTSNCDGQTVDSNLLSDIKWAAKPKIVAESAVQPPAAGSPVGFINYLSRVRDVVEGNDFVGWTYIDSDWPAHDWSSNTWGDSRIEVEVEVKAWFEENVVNSGQYVFG